ncbi:MAG: hypothetical protein MR658_04600, partial [Campylobacter sp.]|uniref:hypothetical protein n=1 Tax=Campylobacter sp. TaxID=205 RepID=UPI002AA628FC
SANLKEYKATGTGNDNITVSGATSIKVDTINTGAGDDKLSLTGSGAVTTVDLGSGNDELIVNHANASIENATINLGAGNDKITITNVSGDGLKGATIDGGAGRDTLIVSGGISGSGDFTLKNIEVLQASGASAKVSYAQIKDQALTLTKASEGKLEIIATNKETTIDLTKLNKNVATGETALDALTLDKVGSGATSGVTVTLNKNDGIAETIKLASSAANVTIVGIASGDKLDLTAINDLSQLSSLVTTALVSTSSVTVSSNKVYFMNAASAIDDATKAAAALTSAVSSFASSAKALIAFNNGGKSYLFKAIGDSTTNDIKASELTLIGIVDNEINASDKVSPNGTIEFV